MTKFHLRAIWWFNVSKSRFFYVDSPPFLLQLDLFRELRQSDAYTCLRLVTTESEMGPHDVILWPHPYSCHYSSRIGPHHLPWDRFAFIFSNCLSAVCLGDHLILVYSYESSLKRVGVHGEKQHSWWEVSEFLTQFFHWYWTPLLQQSLPCGLFFPVHKQFSWWENMQTSGYLKAACWGQCSCLSIVWLWYCSWAALPSFCQEHKRCNHVVKQILIGTDPLFSKWCCHDWQFVTLLQQWGALPKRKNRFPVLSRL